MAKQVQKSIPKKATKKAASPSATKKVSTAKNDTEAVNDYLKALQHPLKSEIETVRHIIKNSNSKINERIKWAAPSFFYKEDIVTFNHRNIKCVQLVFHHKTVVEIKSPLLEGDYKDRRLLHFKNMDEVTTNSKELTRIMNELIKKQ